MNKPYSTGCTQVCNQGRDCTCVVQQCQSVAPEGGNVWFVSEEPDMEPLSLWETIVFFTSMTALSVISLGLMAAGVSFFYHLFF